MATVTKDTYFEKVPRFADIDIEMPRRATAASAGYDLFVAEDIVIPPYDFFVTKMRDYGFDTKRHEDYYGFIHPFSLDEMAAMTKETKAKPTLVSTGVMCHLRGDQYLKIVPRSSLPLKHWLICANSEGIIDSDYANNPDNQGEIFVELINLSPFAIQLYRGDKIAQGIICEYGCTYDDTPESENREGGFGSTS